MTKKTEPKEYVRIKYYEDNMTNSQHMVAYIIFALLIAVVLYIYYHLLIPCIIAGLLLAFYQEKNYAKSVAKKRRNQLRLQFKEFLEIISISISGGSGRSLENAIIDSVHDLTLMYNSNADIVREISIIANDYQNAGIPMVTGFQELAERSDVDDIMSFATILKTIEGKTSDFGIIISQTHDIIRDKVEITMEIETAINSSKSEAYMMLVLPIAMIALLSFIGSDFLGTLYTTAIGRGAATIGAVCTLVSFVIATKATEIEV